MNLINITVKGLKAIRKKRTIHFTSGLNIIKGSDNEAGKSSLRLAITKALFQDPTTTNKEIIGLTSWGTDEPWEIELEFQADSKRYRIAKSLKDGTCQLIDISADTIITTNKHTFAAKIAEITGCPSEIFFLSTACLEQEEMIRIIPQGTTKTERGEAFGAISKRLQATISGSEEADITKIVSRLYSKIHHKDAKGPKWHLQNIAERIELLNSQKIPLEEKVNRLMANRRKLNSIEEELEEVNKELPPKQQLLEKNNRIKQLSDEIKADKEQYKRLQQAKELKKELDKIEAELTKEFGFMGKDNLINALETARNELQIAAQQKNSIQELAEKRQVQKPAIWLLASSIVASIAGLVGALIASKYLGIALIVGLLLLLYWVFQYKGWKGQIKLISGDIAELERKIQEKERAVREILGTLNFRDYNEFLNQSKKYSALTEKRKEVTYRLRGITGDKDWNQFEQENEDLEIEISAKQKELEQSIAFKLEPLDLQKLESEVQRLQERKIQLETEKGGLKEFFRYTDADTDQLAEIEEELKGLEQEREFWNRKQTIYNITREALDQAHKETLYRAAQMLEKELGRYVSIITNERYSQVKIDETDLSIKTFSPEKKDWVDVTELSRATQDQFYIAARFALVKLITEGKQPPLLLDDPFVNFHPKRLEKTMSLLQELAKENQILLFTCSDNFDHCGNVISVD